MHTASLARSLCGLLALLLVGSWVADAQLDGLAEKLAAMKASALKMNRDMGVRPTRTREDEAWEKATGRTPASLNGQRGGPAAQTESCFDMNTRCGELVARGSCTLPNSIEWMTHNCRRSCGVCGTMTDAAPMPEKTKAIPTNVADQIKHAFGGANTKRTAAKPPKSRSPPAAPSPTPTPTPTPTPRTRGTFAHHPLPRTRKVAAADDFGSFGKMTTAQYFGAVKKLEGVSNILPVMKEMGLLTVADLAYANAQHVSAAMKLRAPQAAKRMGLELALVERAMIEAQAGLRKLLSPFKQKLFDQQKL